MYKMASVALAGSATRLWMCDAKNGARTVTFGNHDEIVAAARLLTEALAAQPDLLQELGHGAGAHRGGEVRLAGEVVQERWPGDLHSAGALTFKYVLWRDRDRSTIATGMTEHACTDLTGKIIRIPKILLDALEKAAV